MRRSVKRFGFGIHRVLFAVLLLASGAAGAQEKPPLPYYDWDACPFECCTYQEWETAAPVTVYKTRSKNSAAAFQLEISQKVRGVTGVVITRQYGVTRAIKPVEIGLTNTSTSDVPLLSLRAGDVVYTLHNIGAGYDLFWYKGKIYHDQISVPEDAWGDVPFADTLKVESRPKAEWWVKIKNEKGQVGWSDQVEAFAHKSSCE